MNKRELLIDADILLHRFSIANESSVDWDDDGDTTICSNLTKAKDDLDGFVIGLLKKTRSGKCSMVLSGPDSTKNFRKQLYPDYKAQRKSLKPHCFAALRKYIEEEYNTYTEARLEADDLMAIMATTMPEQYIICTIDKDLESVPCHIFNWSTDKSVRQVNYEEARHNFYTQALTGDTVDNYKGAKGIGPVNAAVLLQGCETHEDYYAQVVKGFELKGQDEEEAIMNLRMAYILREGDYNFDLGTIKLWGRPRSLVTTYALSDGTFLNLEEQSVTNTISRIHPPK